LYAFISAVLGLETKALVLGIEVVCVKSQDQRQRVKSSLTMRTKIMHYLD